MREKNGRYYAATGSKGYRWLESEMVRELGLAHILESNIFSTEKFLEHIRNCKLGTGSRPFAGVLTIFVLGNIDRVIHQAHPVVCMMNVRNLKDLERLLLMGTAIVSSEKSDSSALSRTGAAADS